MAHRALEDKALIFLQMTRTAGLAIIATLQEEFGPENVFKLGGLTRDTSHSYEDFLEAAERDRYAVYAGHFVYGAHRHIPRPCDYITALRDPVERVLSEYERRMQDAPRRIDIAEWLATDFEAANGMVKRLSGMGERDGGVFDFQHEKPMPAGTEIGEDDLERALDNLEAHFSCVMLHGHFVENMVLLQRRYGTRPLFSLNRQHLNRSPRPIRRESYPADVIDRIEERNAYDIRLYEKARAHYLRRLEGMDDAFREEVRIMSMVSEILRDEKAGMMSTPNAFQRLNAAIQVLVGEGKAGDAVQIVKRFTVKPYANEKFCAFAIGFMNAHGSREDLIGEAENYRARFGEDAFLKPIAKELGL